MPPPCWSDTRMEETVMNKPSTPHGGSVREQSVPLADITGAWEYS
jgi:hypothetical protein